MEWMKVMMTLLRVVQSVAAGAGRGLAVAALLISLNGCGPQASGGGGAVGAGSMQKAVSAFDAQRYREAHDQAAAVMSKSTGAQREEAAYLAGLSSYQLGDLTAAEDELGQASVSGDSQTAGRAKAMLGQMRLDQYRWREAASCFGDASRLIEGEDARQAAWHAGLAYRQAGDEAAAKRWLDGASSAQFDQSVARSGTPGGGSVARGRAAGSGAAASTSASTRSPATASSATSARPSNVMASNTGQAPSARATTGVGSIAAPDSVGFTLQVGAFNDRARAKRAAEEAESLSKKESLGRVRVLPRRDAHGQPMYLVQVGWWVTRTEAAAARSKIGKLEYIVAPAAPLT
jgi:septal ring-binding cell division protein DamX